MKNYYKTLILTFIISAVVIILSAYVQLNGQKSVENYCSYLDPLIVDILAFSVGLFLVCEGFYRLIEHKNISIKKQLTRSVRIAMGFAILTIHLIQFIHK